MVGIATSERNRVEKILQDAKVKLSSALSDIFGVSGQLMLCGRKWAPTWVSLDRRRI